MPLHRPTMGTIRSGLWAPDTPYSSKVHLHFSLCAPGALGDFSADKIVLKPNTCSSHAPPHSGTKIG